jgi:hypothetical protein
MGDLGVQLWQGDFASYFAHCRDEGRRERAVWHAEMDAEPPCRHGTQLYVDHLYVGCESCWAETLR